MKRLFLYALFLFSAGVGQMMAQEAHDEAFRRRIPIKVENYQNFKNISYMTLFNDDKNIYGGKSSNIASSETINDYDISPTGRSFALLKKRGVYIYNLTRPIGQMQERIIKNRGWNPIALFYSPDANFLNVVDDTRIVHVLSIRDNYNEVRTFSLVELSHDFTLSDKSDIESNSITYLVATNDRKFYVYNYETGLLRTEMSMDAHINSVALNTDNTQIAIATSDGNVSIYDMTETQCKLVKTIEGVQKASDVVFHKEGKYIAVVRTDSHISLINLKDSTDVQTLELHKGVEQVRLLHSANGEDVLYTKEGMPENDDEAFVYIKLTDLLPYYWKRLQKELDALLKETDRKHPGETNDQFRQRLTDEITTRMAGDMVQLLNFEVVGYDRDNSVLVGRLTKKDDVNLRDFYEASSASSQDSVCIKMPEGDLAFFGNPEDLEFRNVIYGLTVNDTFEVIYAEIYNKKNGKTYVFDKARKVDDHLPPIVIRELVAKEEERLKLIADEIVLGARSTGVISDHTHIKVDTSTEESFDADHGGVVWNYNIDFSYEVEQEYTAHDDFAAGHYQTKESAAAMSMLAIVQRVFEDEFAKYIQAGKQVVITLSGSADALPIRRKIPYNGCYGNFEGYPCYIDDALSHVSVTKSSGITENEQLAFLRAEGVKDWLQTNVPQFNEMNLTWRTNVEVNKGTGSEFRRIGVRFQFIDAFAFLIK